MKSAALMLMAMTLIAAAPPPPLMFWAWERPTDLRAIPRNAGVAFLAATAHFSEKGVRIDPRRDPLLLEPETYRMAVVRINTNYDHSVLSPANRRRIVDAIFETFELTSPDALQLDFDAVASEREGYRALLGELRAKLGPKPFLSMTALVSWCGAKSWIDGLPVDEVVPMTFQMGFDTDAIETKLRSGGQFENTACRSSIGVSTQVMDRRPGRYARAYVFALHGWSDPEIRKVSERFK